MQIHSDLKRCLVGEQTSVGEHPVLIGIRVRLARNLEEFPFPNRANSAQKRDVLGLCEKAVNRLTRLKNPICMPLDSLNELEKKLLLEAHCVSPELIQSNEGTGVVLDTSKRFAFMINEEDHLRLQVLSKQNHFRQAWQWLDRLDSELEGYLDYAFSPEWGYLTACPTNLGTGMRASAMLHLPGLVLSDQMKPVVRALAEMGMTVRGLFGEQSKAVGNIFQVSNQSSLGNDEESLLIQIERVVNKLMEKELYMRKRLFTDDRVQLLDKIGRALGLLRNSYSISTEEAISLISFIRLGIDLGCFPKKKAKFVQALWAQVQSAHLQLKLNTILSSNDENGARAEFLRKTMSKFPDPNYRLGNN